MTWLLTYAARETDICPHRLDEGWVEGRNLFTSMVNKLPFLSMVVFLNSSQRFLLFYGFC